MEILKKNRLLPEQWDRGGGFAQAGVFGQRGMNGMAARRMVSCKMAAPRTVLFKMAAPRTVSCKMAVYKP